MIGVEMAGTRHGVPLTKRERAQHEAEQAEVRRIDKEAIAIRAKASGMKKGAVRADDGSVQDVWQRPDSFERMGLERQLIAAIDRFGIDYMTAHRGVKGQSWEMPVDGQGSAHGAHLARVNAQGRLRACREEIGRRNFDICVGVLLGATAQKIHILGGNQHVVVKADIRNALTELDNFYTGRRRKDRTWEAFERFNAARAAMIEKAEREVG